MTDINDLFRAPDSFDNWQSADNLYRSGEPDMLVRMLLSPKVIPPLQRKLLAEIVGGKVKLPSKRGKKNAKLTHDQRAQIYRCVSYLQSRYKHRKGELEKIAEDLQMEVAALIELKTKERADWIADLARHYGISKASVVTIARRFKPVLRPKSEVREKGGKRQ